MQIDVLFIDPACNKSYTWESHDTDGLGGTELTTIRLAEGFGSKGLKVVVAQHFNIPYLESPNKVGYCGPDWLSTLKPKNVIVLRAQGRWDMLGNAKKFVWLHDASTPTVNHLTTWVPEILKHQVTGIAVSDWHVKNLLQYAPGFPLQRIYSPVDEGFYQPPVDYDKNQLVWLASPHKGLKQGLEVFRELKRRQPEMKLVVFNPGYYTEPQGQHPGVAFLGSQPRSVVKSVLARSLCLFYPSVFEESFGMVAAEANALGVPVACYEIAGLAESSVGPFCKDAEDLVTRVLEYRNVQRPKVSGQERFRFQQIFQDWLKVLRL